MLLIFIFILFFVFTFIYVSKRSFVFSLAYSLLFLYTIFTQFAYLLYPEKLALFSGGQYYGVEFFLSYWMYIFLSFAFIFAFFIILYGKDYNSSIKLEISGNFKNKKFYNLLYFTVIIVYEMLMLAFLLKNYSTLSYYTQYILKRNTFWFYLFDINGIVLLSIFCGFLIEKNKLIRVFYLSIFVISLSIFIVTSMRAGQRIEFFNTLLAFTSFLWIYFLKGLHNKKEKLRILLFLFFLIFIFIGFSQGVRTLRGSTINIINLIDILKRPRTFLTFFSFESLVFQDWLVPSLTLVTSMKYEIISPSLVLESNLKVFIPFILHPSLGGILSRIIDPTGWTGYGYYILTEGYNFMGFLGFLYSSFIFVVGLRLWELIFTKTKDNMFNSFMCGIIAFSYISIIRGQSISFIKVIYLYFIPAILLFRFMSGKRIYLVKSK